MSLTAGTRLGPYEVLGPLGAGGMGEVYQARDTRLGRTVAVKVLPADLSADLDRRARFEREARAVAALAHPHICTLHDIGEQGSTTYLVMEHLAGETLAQRLRKGPLPIAQALDIGAQIAEALDAAHKAGIVHRDLKPSNVMLTRSGAGRSGVTSVKLLDFGLAKLRESGAVPVGVNVSVPTATEPLTRAGEALGTRPYMAPEQVEGKTTDARTDLWALGCVLYEMVTGRPAFAGDSVASITAAILTEEPEPLAVRQPITPPALEHVVRKCLAKHPDDRWDSAHDIAEQLRWVRETRGVAAPAGLEVRSRQSRRLVLAVIGALVAAAIGAGVGWHLHLRVSQAPPSPVHVSLDVRPAEQLNGGLGPGLGFTRGGSHTALAWTPDGQALVFVGRRGGVQQLYVRRLDAAESRPLPNTEGALAPAVSADGQWVAFWADGAFKKVPIGGGLATDLAFGGLPSGLAWDDRGRIFVGFPDGPIGAIPPDGTLAAVTTVDTGKSHGLPWPLPGGEVLLYTERRRQFSWGDEEVVAQTLATGVRTVLLKDAADARYVATGHLVFLRRGVLLAVPFDAERLAVHGTPVPVLDTVAQSLTGDASPIITGAGQFAVAPTGALAWVTSPVNPYPDSRLVTIDRHGQVTPLSAPVRSYDSIVRVSPEGRRLAVAVQTLSELGLWVSDLDRGSLSPLNREGEASWLIWTPDGLSVLYSWLSNGRFSLAAQRADGTAPPRDLLTGGYIPVSFTPDGRHLAALRSGEVVTVTVENGQASVEQSTDAPEYGSWPEISPDGRWLAYGSRVSGQLELYVRAYPGPGPATPVSLEGGGSPAWHPAGRELFFTTCDSEKVKCGLMAVEFAPGSPPRLGRPRLLFGFRNDELVLDCVPSRCYDVARDGQRFYAVQRQTTSRPPPVTHVDVVLNWFQELKAKVPSGTR